MKQILRPLVLAAFVENDEPTDFYPLGVWTAANNRACIRTLGDANSSIQLGAASIEDGGFELLASLNRQEPIPSGSDLRRDVGPLEQLVQFCHAYRHWQQVSLKMRFRPPDQSVEQGSKYSRKKRHDEWKREVHQSERHMYNAAHLAADKIVDMSRLVSNMVAVNLRRFTPAGRLAR